RAHEHTLVFFEAPHRIDETLADMAATFGARRAAIARELTKIHEEVIRGTLKELASVEQPARGEIAIVVEGAPRAEAEEPDAAQLAAAVAALERDGESRKEAIAAV